MQKTTIDRWLQKRYVQVCHIYCNTLPENVPSDATLDETTEETGGRYLYRFTVSNDKAMNILTANLEVNNITYASRVAEVGGWKGKFFNNPNKSFTMQVCWLIFVIVIASIILSGLPVKLWKELSADEEPSDKKKAQIVHDDSHHFLALQNNPIEDEPRDELSVSTRTFAG